ncbi:TonB-dependent receptor [Hymenobacter sp. BT523]|uniref:outer membrane beta-barrel family protein n=1 Tax=Hymenobacter sp. BT523 TaxID=2795725 RepID=UPI0018EA8BF7|nr:outer membrane beta-barrel family protein [Hymenobacter sp. BT523]MBJ6110321.1 TonB-dependent receptor [Hymenobacter sp. BT523]
MKALLSLLVLLWGSGHLCQAQPAGSFTGLVADEKSQAVPFANAVLVRAADSVFVAGGVANGAGHFALPAPAPGAYRLRISALGYRRWQSGPLAVTAPGQGQDFGTIQLVSEARALKEVVVQGLKPTIVQYADRLVVNVEGKALAAGNTAYDVLARAPGVFIDPEGAIQLNGKAGAQVMLDGKLTYLSAKELQSLLQSMAADNIKTLELITNPSAKYDAAGTGGLINITLKKNTARGLNGSVNAGAQYNGLAGYTTGGTLNYKRGAWNSFGNLDFSRRPTLRTLAFTRVFSDVSQGLLFDQTGREEGFRNSPALRLGTDWTVRPGHTLGGMLYVLRADQARDLSTATSLRSDQAATNQFIDALTRTTSELRSHTANLHYLGQLDTAGTTLALDLNYVNLSSTVGNAFTNHIRRETGAVRDQLLTSDNPVNYDIYAAKLDVERPLARDTKLEAGAKISQVVSDNDLRFFNVVAEKSLPDLGRTNHFVYQENIYAAYANLSRTLSKRWSVEAGLRAEQTHSRGTSRTLGQTSERRYLNLFPSVFVQQTVSPQYQVSYQYSRRIDRPRYEELNPFVIFLDPYSVVKGNPGLRPQYTTSLQVVQTWKSLYNLTVGYAHTRDYMAQIPLQDTRDTLTVFQQQNLSRYENFNATLSAPWRLMAKWQTTNVLTGTYERVSTELNGQGVRNSRLSLFAQTTHTVQLPAKLRLEVNGSYVGPGIYGVYRVQGIAWVDTGLKRTFAKDQLEASLSVTDVFRSRQIGGVYRQNSSLNEFAQYRGEQAVRLSLRYKFARGEKFDSKRRASDLDEVNRAGR